MKTWLNDAVVYEIYPQSFNDTNGDGIGDLQGIIEKLDYIQDCGFNVIWLNPINESSFFDAGYWEKKLQMQGVSFLVAELAE